MFPVVADIVQELIRVVRGVQVAGLLHMNFYGQMVEDEGQQLFRQCGHHLETGREQLETTARVKEDNTFELACSRG